MKNLTIAHLTLAGTPEQNIDAAATAGFGAVGLRICGRRPGDAFEPRILGRPAAARALHQRAIDQGVRLSNLSAFQFYPEVGWDDLAAVIEAAVEMRVPVLVVNNFQPDEAAFADLFARYCNGAAKAGLRIALEFLPYSATPSLEAALGFHARRPPVAVAVAGGLRAAVRCPPARDTPFERGPDARSANGSPARRHWRAPAVRLPGCTACRNRDRIRGRAC
jgi:hypothetical protein